MEREDDKIARGFDRGVDYTTMKKKLIENIENTVAETEKIVLDSNSYEYKKGTLMKRYIYLLISIIQLRNGSRISEAILAFKGFIKPDQSLDEKVIVRIAKSKATRIKENGKRVKTKTRYRKMIFPTKWVKEINDIENIRDFLEDYRGDLNKRVLDFLSRTYKCNTHSLRYAFINYMLYDQKKEMTAVAKFVGHKNTNMLVIYTQAKESDKLFDIDI
jgi:hypothetical protein